MQVRLRKSAIEDFDKLDKKTANKLLNKIALLKDFPNVRNVKKLVNFEPAFRLRVGDFRILFEVDNDCIYVARVMLRKDVYR